MLLRIRVKLILKKGLKFNSLTLGIGALNGTDNEYFQVKPKTPTFAPQFLFA